MTKPGRIACCIPFCTRTANAEKHAGDDEIICPVHWRMAPRQLKARLSKYKRLGKKLAARGRDTTRMYGYCCAVWEEIKQSVMP